ncbi:MAG: ATP-binding cassette domain-containing protein, partial [Candidatus Electrothrix sp. MAN1_4]|nr:ATP-binding cassette domain-containing protein [Candidatus Electrothrix sp. MAN1_4]
KSTLMKLLCGLYPQDSGQFLLDGQRVSMITCRNLFSTVFADMHLFDELYGIETVDEDMVDRLLNRFELAHKTALVDNRRFSHLKLSDGQKKRLALIIALLDGRQIYLFDEWAADQDPQFRSYFYEVLLPEFKAQGKTVVVVTHDDQFFHVADRVLTLDQGRILEEEAASHFVDRLHSVHPDTANFSTMFTSGVAASPKDSSQNQTRIEYAEQHSWADHLEVIKGSFRPLIMLAALYAVCDVGIVAIMHYVLELPASQTTERYFLLFLLVVMLSYTVTTKFDFRVLYLIENSLANLRLTLIDQIRHTDLATYLRIGAEQIYTALTFDIEAVSKISSTVSNLLRSLMLLIGSLLYLTWLSWEGGVMGLTVLGLVGISIMFLRIQLYRALGRIRAQEKSLFGAIRHILEGFKELRLNPKKNDDLFHSSLKRHAAALRREKIQGHNYRIMMETVGFLVNYGLMLLLLFLSPLLYSGTGHLFLKICTVLLYLPINGYLMVQIAQLTLANISVERFYRLGKTLRHR